MAISRHACHDTYVVVVAPDADPVMTQQGSR